MTQTTPDSRGQSADVFAESVFAAVKGYVGQEFARQFEAAIAPLLKRLDEARIPVDGKDGRDGEAGPEGKRGEKGDIGEAGEPGLPGQHGEPGLDGRDGKSGAPGRDAAHIEVLTGIDEHKSYSRGTFATHKGGLWRAADTTDGMDGWECITRGVDHESEVSEQGGRVIKRKTVYSDGTVFEREIKTTVMVYRGLYSEERSYEPGDTTTWAGSIWHCDEPTTEKPGNGCKAWRLSVKRGADARLKD